MTDVELSQLVGSWADVDASQGEPDDAAITDALTEAGAEIALLRSGQALLAVVRLLADGSLARSNKLVTVDAEPDTVSDAFLLRLAQEVAPDPAGAVIVLRRDGTPAGVIPREPVVHALPQDLLRSTQHRQGSPRVPALRFECRRCAPPSVRLLRAPEADNAPPTCPNDFLHGAMMAVER